MMPGLAIAQWVVRNSASLGAQVPEPAEAPANEEFALARE